MRKPLHRPALCFTSLMAVLLATGMVLSAETPAAPGPATQAAEPRLEWGVVAPPPGETPTTPEDFLQRYREFVRRCAGVEPEEPALREVTILRLKRSRYQGPDFGAEIRHDTGMVTNFGRRESPVTVPGGRSSGRTWAPAGDEAAAAVADARKALEILLGLRFDDGAASLDKLFLTQNGKRIVSIQWRMVYHGYVHPEEFFGANIDITDPDHPILRGFTSNGPMIVPPPPDIRVTEAEAREKALKTVTDYWTTYRQDIPYELVPRQAEGTVVPQYHFRNDFYRTGRRAETEETHLVYPFVIGAIPPKDKDGGRTYFDAHGDFSVLVDAETGEIIGGGYLYQHARER